MSEEKKQSNKEVTGEKVVGSGAGNIPMSEKGTSRSARSPYSSKRGFGRGQRRDRDSADKKDDFDQRILDIARVTRVMAGGKRMRFRVCVAVGDKKGKIGVGVGKGADVTIAVNKAVNKAKKAIIEVPFRNDTIPHEVHNKFGAAKILFKPTKSGRGVIAGGVVRVILKMAGVKNITSKILGSSNKLSNAKCTIDALKKLKRVEVRKEVKKESQNDKIDNKEKDMPEKAKEDIKEEATKK